jgi:hypothetical protein
MFFLMGRRIFLKHFIPASREAIIMRHPHPDDRTEMAHHDLLKQRGVIARSHGRS